MNIKKLKNKHSNLDEPLEASEGNCDDGGVRAAQETGQDGQERVQPDTVLLERNCKFLLGFALTFSPQY